jgi:hypothetical protein
VIDFTKDDELFTRDPYQIFEVLQKICLKKIDICSVGQIEMECENFFTFKINDCSKELIIHFHETYTEKMVYKQYNEKIITIPLNLWQTIILVFRFAKLKK